MVICLLITPAAAWEPQPQWLIATDNSVYAATPAGLYQYDADTERFLPELFPAEPSFIPFEIEIDADQLWAIGDTTVGYIDLFSGGRYLYFPADGLPPGTLSCMAFTEDYAWVGSDAGAARFDRLIEQWEYFPLSEFAAEPGYQNISAIEPVEDYVYFTTDAGVLRFDSNTETFYRFGVNEGLRGAPYRDLQKFGNDLWCFGEHGIDIYSTDQNNWSYLGIEQGFRNIDWIDVEEIGGELYFVSSGGIDVCDVTTRRVSPFLRENRLAGYELRDLIGTARQLWFATDQGLLLYTFEDPTRRQAESWNIFNQERGAQSGSFQSVSSSGEYIFGLSVETLEVLDPQSEIFLTPFALPKSVQRERPSVHYPSFAWDQEGLRMQPGENSQIGVTGYYTYLSLSDGTYTEDRLWGRLQPYYRHASGRSVGGLYDNTDPDEELYGATYRGLSSDLIRRIEAGNRVKYRQSHNLFFGQSTLRGGTVMLEAGERLGNKKRSTLHSEVYVGERVTRSKRDFFTGADGPIYSLNHEDLLVGSAEIILNGQVLSEDEYTLSYPQGQFFFNFTGWELLNAGDIIEVRYQYRLEEEEIDELLTAGEVTVSRGDAFQISASAMQQESREDSTGDIDTGFGAAQLSGESRGTLLGGEGYLIAGFAAAQETESEAESYGSHVEGNFNRGAWTLEGKWSAYSDSLPTLEDRSTEFGYLKGESSLGIRFEPQAGFRVEGAANRREGKTGREDNYRVKTMFTPLKGTSAFGSVDYFDADTDSLNRDRWIVSLGMESEFSPGLLNSLKLRSSRLFVLGRLSEVELDSLNQQEQERIKLRTQSFLVRWNLIPGPKISLFPELQWSKSETAAGDADFQPAAEEITPKTTIFTRDLVPGITTYLTGEGTYSQADYDPQNGNRDVGWERQGTAQIDVSPGVYWEAFNPVSLRLTVTRNAEDSLLNIDDDLSLFDLGFRWKDYPTNVRSYRADSDALQVTWTPFAHWLLYQSATEIRSSVNPTEQYYATRLEWKPGSGNQVYWKYNLRRVLQSGTDDYEHRPGIEWYRRWSSRTYTRTQLYINYQDTQLSEKWEIAPGGYIDQRLALPWYLGDSILRMDLSAVYSSWSRPLEEETITAGGYARWDWNFWKGLLLRLRYDHEYVYSITDSQQISSIWTFEFRLSARF